MVDAAEILRLYADKLSTREIGRRLRVGTSTVIRVLAEAGAARPCGRAPAVERAAIVAALETGEDPNAVALRLGAPRSSVYKAARAAGIELRGWGGNPGRKVRGPDWKRVECGACRGEGADCCGGFGHTLERV